MKATASRNTQLADTPMMIESRTTQTTDIEQNIYISLRDSLVADNEQIEVRQIHAETRRS